MTRIRLNRKVICSMYAKLNVLQLANNPFSDLQEKLKRKERKDAVRSKSKVFVVRYCHNDSNAHRIDSNNLDRVKIEGEDKHHVIRIWENALTQKEKYRDFLQSIEYQQFKYMYPEYEILKQVFIEQLCPCLRDPSMRSCVDILCSALEECILAIRGAVKSDPILKDKIETCNCDVHARPRRASSGVTIDRVVRDHSVHEIIDLTYCQAVADPFMAAGAGSGMVIPKFIRWKCVTCEGGIISCDDCGIDKTFQDLARCPIFSSLITNRLEDLGEGDELEEPAPNDSEKDVLETEEPKAADHDG